MDRLTIVLALMFLLAANVTSAQITTSGVLTEDTTWSGTVNVLGDVTVPEGITLTVEPGTVVRFAARSDQQSSGENPVLTEFMIQGILIAKGTPDNMITFTSELEDNPVPGDWGGIRFVGPVESTVRSVLDYCIIEYGATNIQNKRYYSFDITNNIIRYSAGRAMWLAGNIGVVRGNTVTDNAAGIYFVTSTSIVDGNIITRNGTGIHIHASGAVVITNNLITDNDPYGIHISGSLPVLGNVSNVDTTDDGGNQIYGNAEYDVRNASAVLIKAEGNYWGTNDPAVIDSHIWDDDEGETVDSSGNTVMSGIVDFEPWLSAPDGDLIYFDNEVTHYTNSGSLSKDETWSGIVKVLGDVTVPGGITLTIEPGTIVRFAARSDQQSSGADSVVTELIVKGVLIARGAADRMITLTSELEENPVPGDWMGITFREHDQKNHTVDSVIDYCVIEYAIYGINCGGGSYQPSPNITNSILKKNKHSGLYLGSYSSEIKGNTIADNGSYGIYIGCSTPTIDDNKITGNRRGLAMHACGASPPWSITRNLITDNSEYGVFISASQPPLGNISNVDTKDDGGNHIYGNGKYDVYNTSATLIKAEGNYWGTNDPDVIDSHIWDDNEGQVVDFGGNTVMPGIVDFYPWLSSPDGGLVDLVTINIRTDQMVSKGDVFIASVNINNITDLAGVQFNISFDPAIIEAVGVEEGFFLSDSGGTYWLEPGIDNAAGEITGIVCAKTSKGGVDGSGTLATVTFRAIDIGGSYIRLQNITLSDSNGEVMPFMAVDGSVTVVEFPSWDVNKDGVVNVVDIVLVGQSFGETPSDPNPDVNGDGVVNIQDIVLVGQHFGETYPPGAPPRELWVIDPQYLPVLAMIYNIMEHSPDSGPGFLATRELIHRLIGSIRVSKAALLQNYPNPFNPDTYIPYQLAEDSQVSLRIYTSMGQLIRTIDLGHKVAGVYSTRDAAGHWDGRSDNGELLASGIYYYSIQAGDFNATRKMVVSQ